MSDFPLLCSGRWAEDDNSGSSVYKLNLVASASTNTKGSYGLLFSSVPFDSDGMILTWQADNGAVSVLADISVGAAASEVVVLSNYFVQGNSGNKRFGVAFIPIQFRAGDRVSMRIQSNVGSANLYVKSQLVKGGFFSSLNLQSPTTYGAATGTSLGVAVTAGTSNAKGSYAQVTSSTTAPIRSLLLCVGNNLGSGIGSSDVNMDVAVGGSGSEQIIVSDLFMAVVPDENGNINSNDVFPTLPVLPVEIPTGTRISVRMKSTTDSLVLQVVIIGWA